MKTTLEATGKEHCFAHSTAAKELGKEITILKPAHLTVCRVRIDDCLITSGDSAKCDYFFRVCETKVNILVEFKGKDVLHAVDQIVKTFLILNKQLKQEPNALEGYIISSSVPSTAEQRFRKAQEKVLKEHGFFIHKKHQKLVLDLAGNSPGR
ncbi:MAG TPA: hypothetical protein VF646_17755 [Cytophagales bacterium]